MFHTPHEHFLHLNKICDTWTFHCPLSFSIHLIVRMEKECEIKMHTSEPALIHWSTGQRGPEDDAQV